MKGLSKNNISIILSIILSCGSTTGICMTGYYKFIKNIVLSNKVLIENENSIKNLKNDIFEINQKMNAYPVDFLKVQSIYQTLELKVSNISKDVTNLVSSQNRLREEVKEIEKNKLSRQMYWKINNSIFERLRNLEMLNAQHSR